MARFLSLLAVLALVAPVPATEPTPVVGLGIVSADQKLVFLPGKDGVEAVDLATGKLVWANKDAAKLAGASDKVVVAWAGDEKKPNAFRVVALDAATGKSLVKSEPIALPEWAVTGPTYGRSFRTAAKVGAEEAVVAWQAGASYAGGAAPTPEIEAAARKNESGLVKLDLATGKATAADGKPKDADFKSGPAGGGTNKVGDWEFRTEEQIPGFKPGAAMKTKVTFTALRGQKEVWARELAGNPWSPPPP